MGCTRTDAVATHRQSTVTVVIDVIDEAAEQRWTAWKLDAARRDVLRARWMRKLFAALVLAPAVWLLWRL